VHIAIFNSTSADTQKAKNAVLDKYGQAGYAHVEGCMKTGIMELFGHDITAETALFASIVASNADHRAILNKAREAGITIKIPCPLLMELDRDFSKRN
jgi:hypothetical protein